MHDERDEGSFVAEGEGLMESGSAEARFEAGDSEEVMLGEGDALDREGLLRVHGLKDGDEVGAEAIHGFAVFDFDDGEVGSGEGVLAGVTGRTGFAFPVRSLESGITRVAGQGGVRLVKWRWGKGIDVWGGRNAKLKRCAYALYGGSP